MVNFPLDLSQDSYIEEIIVTKKAFSLHWNIELCLKSENRPIFKEPIISLFSEYNKKNSQNLSFQEYELLKKINYYKTTRLYWGYYYDFIKRRIVVKTTVPILIINPSLEEEIFYERLVVRLI